MLSVYLIFQFDLSDVGQCVFICVKVMSVLFLSTTAFEFNVFFGNIKCVHTNTTKV